MKDKEKIVNLLSPETQITYTMSQDYWQAWRKHSQQYEKLGLGLDFCQNHYTYYYVM